MKTVKGNLVEMGLNGDFDVIIHGCNCLHTMGAGIAKEIREKIPAAYRADCTWWQKGDSGKLGKYSAALVHPKGASGHELVVINAYTQYGFGGRKVGTMDVNYAAIRKVFKRIADNFPGKRIGIPMIGAGLAGGDWKVIGR